MRIKSIFLFILFFFNSSFVSCHTKHYDHLQFIEMEIFRNNKVIGFNNYYFSNKKNITIIENKIKFNVELLGAKVFSLEGYGVEKYNEDKLISYNSETLQNNKKKFVNLYYDLNIDKFVIKGSSYKGNTSPSSIIGNWWNHKLLQADRQISPISGSIKEQQVIFIKKDKIELYGKTYAVDHFKLISKNKNIPKKKRLNFDIWYDKKNAMILKVSYSRMGNWEYRVKNFK